ncbi:amidase domain-containing protein [Cohnella fermenti]|uniref:amidase domain-containing protein n=1 Tax=Cohnella fermenti TaxID=2565925 RepID=UPI001E4FA08F|nr:amidase domain-containing protein [Cohnella fermenti]
MADKDNGWKKALVEYVNTLNEDGLAGNAEPYRSVPDAEHRLRLLKRSQALARREGGIRMKPLRSEMRARLISKEEKAAEATCVVRFHLIRSYEQDQLPWLEERAEQERIRFVRTGSRWRIDRIEPVAAENAAEEWPGGGEDSSAGYGWGRRTVIPSMPLVLAGQDSRARSRVLAGPGIGRSGWGEGWFDPSRRGAVYRREDVVAYAEQWWDEANPSYENFEVNCTNYVSQCIFAGGAPMNYTGRRESGWWYKGRANGQELWSYSWAVANALQTYLSQPRTFGLRAELVESPQQLMPGDVICYDWDGNGRFQHNTIVVAFTPDGMPLVNANTVSSRHRYWDYRDSYAWTERTRYRFFHIADEF